MQENQGKDLSILIVNEYETMSKILRTCLANIGFKNVTDVASGQAAIEKISSQEFQLVISDWNMSQMMGLDLVKQLRADERFNKLLFLMITPDMQKENIIEAVKAGVSNYIAKPFTPDQLQSKIDAIFSGN